MLCLQSSYLRALKSEDRIDSSCPYRHSVLLNAMGSWLLLFSDFFVPLGVSFGVGSGDLDEPDYSDSSGAHNLRLGGMSWYTVGL